MISERIRIGEHYYLLASALALRQPRVLLNYGDSFAIFDSGGDIPLAGRESYGLFHRGTRFLDRFEVRLNGAFPVLLSSAPTEDGSELLSHLSNADESRDGEIVLERDTVSLERNKTLGAGVLYEQLQLRNFGREHLELEVTLLFGADFADVFELRGVERPRRGEMLETDVDGRTVRLRYRGLDGVVRESVLTFAVPPEALTATSAQLRFALDAGDVATCELNVRCCVGAPPLRPQPFSAAVAAVRHERHQWTTQFARISSSNEHFNEWLNRSLHDLAMLRADTPAGSYIYAGIPWFAAVFGRDGLITALETLAFAPVIAAETLRTLAALQGRETDPTREEEPGKIVHEMRQGEMAALGEVPFGRYYGSIDATPLFVLLLCAYADRTADLALVRELWPAAVAAIDWVSRCGDRDGDGYVEYARRNARGLVNQGWKDSHDAIVHADGTLAEPPIALAEVQGYVYAAYHGLAGLARRLGKEAEAATWQAQAVRLRAKFHRDFWLPELDCYALALDGAKRPCRVVSSNAGHCLFSGIANAEVAPAVAARLMREDMFCGWGIRTLSALERRYNPMSYHNGSVWPHDNSLIAAGFSRYRASEPAGQVLSALFDAALAIEERRLPELFCGFPRRREHKPVPYPVACSPQAWAAGSVFLLLQSTLGLEIDAWERHVTFHGAMLPPWLARVEIRGLEVGDARVDLNITRGRSHAAVEVIEKVGQVEVVVRG